MRSMLYSHVEKTIGERVAGSEVRSHLVEGWGEVRSQQGAVKIAVTLTGSLN